MTRTPYANSHLADLAEFRHKFLLNRLLMVLVRHASGSAAAERSLQTLAQEFGPDGLNLPAPYYHDWQVALMAAVRATDRQLTPALEMEWRQVMADACRHFVGVVASLPSNAS